MGWGWGGGGERLQAAGEDEKFPNAFNPLSFLVEFVAAKTEVNGNDLIQGGLLGSSQTSMGIFAHFKSNLPPLSHFPLHADTNMQNLRHGFLDLRKRHGKSERD